MSPHFSTRMSRPDPVPSLSAAPRSVRVLVSESVFEDAICTVRDGTLYVEFDAEDLPHLAIPLKEILDRGVSDG